MFCNLHEYSKRIPFFLLLIGALSLTAQIKTGADQLNSYLPMLKNKRVALVVNPTSVIGKTHLADTLSRLKVRISVIFAPEHGFRGDAEAGAPIKSGKDPKTGLQVISLYGKHKKPTPQDMAKTDVVVFDIQDVGARFYTYISTLHYVMEACAEQKKQLIVLDRPNPNGFYIDGPVLDTGFRSFVGMHPVPVVHGMTMGEYAQMINGERWLKGGIQCGLTVIPMSGYDHETRYDLPIAPSPNLRTREAIALYPSLCFFEGTNYSLGRGTDKPFELVGKPGLSSGTYSFTPRSIKGAAEKPPYMNQACRGYLLTTFAQTVWVSKPALYLTWLIDLYRQESDKSTFFTPFFDTLAGSDQLRQQIMEGKSEDEIRKSWQPALKIFRETRMKYLLYKDFTVIYSADLK